MRWRSGSSNEFALPPPLAGEGGEGEAASTEQAKATSTEQAASPSLSLPPQAGERTIEPRLNARYLIPIVRTASTAAEARFSTPGLA